MARTTRGGSEPSALYREGHNMTRRTPQPDGSPRTLSPEQFAETLSDKALHCRELGHVWRPHTVTFDELARCYERSLRCTSCRTVRSQVLDARGHVIRNSYRYPDGYLAQHVERVGQSRDAYRVEAVVRFLQAQSPKETGRALRRVS